MIYIFYLFRYFLNYYVVEIVIVFTSYYKIKDEKSFLSNQKALIICFLIGIKVLKRQC